MERLHLVVEHFILEVVDHLFEVGKSVVVKIFIFLAGVSFCYFRVQEFCQVECNSCITDDSDVVRQEIPVDVEPSCHVFLNVFQNG